MLGRCIAELPRDVLKVYLPNLGRSTWLVSLYQEIREVRKLGILRQEIWSAHLDAAEAAGIASIGKERYDDTFPGT